jgi:hypothetical protein
MRVNAFVSMVVAAGLVAASTIAVAQNATPPPRETPRPQDIEPGVNTSAAPARETPRPEDLEPRVDTSATSPSSARDRGASEAAARPTRSAAGNAAAPATGSPSTPAPASGASATGATGASPNAGSAKPGARGKAVDRLELDTTQITGNRELPKVLYIVPWKRSDLGDLVGKPVNSLLDEVLTPVDRDVFQRENRYYRALTPGAVENDALSAPDGRPQGPQRNPVPTNSAPAAGMPGSATHPTNTAAGGVSTGSGTAASPPRDEK